MRKFMIGLGILAIILAAILAGRDDTTHGTALAPVVADLTPTGSQLVPSATTPSQVRSAASLTQSAPSTPTEDAPPAQSAPSVFFVRDADGFAAFDSSTGRLRFNLPRGLPSADWTHFYWARVDPDSTAIIPQNLVTGGPTRTGFEIKGQWALGAVSASGRWLALRALPGARGPAVSTSTDQGPTRLAIVDTSDGTIKHSIVLDGNFDVDALSSDGTALFLIEHLPDLHANRYSVRLYDLTEDRLLPGSVRVKGETEDMVGEASGSVASPDGRWLLTLYLNTANHSAFIHELDLQNRIALCLDLPSGTGDLGQLRQYALTLSPDGGTIYATNPALGVLAEVSLDSPNPGRTVTFTPHAEQSSSSSSSAYAPGEKSVVSIDGGHVYFSDGEQIWAYETLTGKVSGPIRVGMAVLGLGASSSGRRLYVVTSGNELAVLFDVQANGSLIRLN